MSVKYLGLSVSISGIDAEDDVVVGFLKGWLKGAVEAGITGNMKEYFKFRDEFDSDIEVELIEQAGKFSTINDEVLQVSTGMKLQDDICMNYLLNPKENTMAKPESKANYEIAEIDGGFIVTNSSGGFVSQQTSAKREGAEERIKDLEYGFREGMKAHAADVREVINLGSSDDEVFNRR